MAFAIGCTETVLSTIIEPRLLGSHAWVYTDATRVWLAGGDPWLVGPPSVIFAGPPPMLALFLPFVVLPSELIAVVSVLMTGLAVLWLIRRLGLPGYWLGFPPLLGAIQLGHPEVFLLILLLFGGRLGGLAALVKPYLGAVLVAQRRWRAAAIAALVLVASAPFLPWALFLQDAELIAATIARQYTGDAVMANPAVMAVTVLALLSLGLRRAIWMGTPLLWPFAQPGYRLMALPLMTPLLAAFWAIPVPGMTVAGLVAQAVLEQVSKRRGLPGWLAVGIAPVTTETGATEEPLGSGRRHVSPAGAA